MSITSRFDSRKGIPIYGDCCNNEKQYVPYADYQQASSEIHRLNMEVSRLKSDLEEERAK